MNNYKKDWDIYRKKNRIVTILLVFGLPSIVVFCIFIRWQFDFEINILFPILAVCWALFWGYLAFKLIRFPCPRCKKPFLLNQAPQLQMSRQCMHCGLKLYEEK